MFTPHVESSVLLPHIVKRNAQTDPGGLFARVPLGGSYAEGFRDVSKLQFHNAINHVAFLLKRNLGESKTFETLAYIAPGDLRYSIIVVAGIKAGYKVTTVLGYATSLISKSIYRCFYHRRGTARKRTSHY